MANFKLYLYAPLLALLLGCIEQEENQFFLDLSSDETKQFHYRDIHNVTLTLSDIEKSIDETGFSPIFKGAFSLENQQYGPFESAWVAFTINILLNHKEIASIQRAGVLQNHKMDVQFQLDLPKFGVAPEKVKIDITPIAWMPSYPLFISKK